MHTAQQTPAKPKVKATQFQIIKRFHMLKPQAKMALTEQLFCKGAGAFQKTVKTLWPSASMQDTVILLKFMIAMKKAAH